MAVTSATCEGFKDGKVVISGTGGTINGGSYLFSNDNVNFGKRNVFGALGAGPQSFYVKDSNNCVRDTIINVPGYPAINLNNLTALNPACYADTNGIINTNATGGVVPLTYQLIKPAMTNTTGIFDSLGIGRYGIRVQDSKGCFKDTTIELTQPDSLHIDLQLTGNDCLGANDGGRAKAVVTGGTEPYTYAWNGGSSSDELIGLPNAPVRVLVTDGHNCMDTAVGVVAYDNCCTPFIPTGFTPNADGRNDVFRVSYKGDVSSLELNVYNRYGEKVFATYRVDGAWDGTYHGKPVDVGTYFYYIKFICGNKGDNRVEFKGDVTLIR